ncbi:N-carbamoyl-L-amino acid hydrolase [Vibrio thalassae]|uniref:N-carbamoyl-L-amino acid hydrolase n=1 Tax=Vibrio thalassae TaxID=1243014 RepID=A0A240EE99_9VIBR|nr:M20 family metallo-hydrolase [Vibrio thalassae]SNX47028.1 N-carbamoyl-L-amino acid hydrolase [Vibrio thalassae]
MKNLGQQAQNCLSELSMLSESKEGVTRRPFTPEHRSTNNYLTTMMQNAGLQVRCDDAGTLIGRYQSRQSSKTLVFGSHQDSIRKGGRYDGIMGVVLPILALEALAQEEVDLPFSVEVMAFADEEGVRFPTALMGPRVLAGTFDVENLALTDADGISLKDAMQNFGLNPDNLSALKRSADDILGFLEVHIEQGPVLESRNLALGVVSAICGIERHEVQFVGESAHAGTCPMDLRKDALAAAAQVICEAERYAKERQDLKITVGRVNVEPNVVNAIPSHASFSIEIRSPEDSLRCESGEYLHKLCKTIASKRNLEVSTAKTYEQVAQPCNDDFQLKWQSAIRALGLPEFTLPSGATHDASAMADLTSIGMLFVRSQQGLSHNPAEYTLSEDMGLAIEAIKILLTQWAD